MGRTSKVHGQQGSDRVEYKRFARISWIQQDELWLSIGANSMVLLPAQHMIQHVQGADNVQG